MLTNTTRATLHFPSQLYQALKQRASEVDTTLSALVRDAVRLQLAEDAEDIAFFEERAHHPARAHLVDQPRPHLNRTA